MADNIGVDNNGADNEENDNVGAYNVGADNMRSDNEGHVTKDPDNKGPYCKGPDNEGPESKGSNSKGPDNKGPYSKGLDKKGPDNTGLDSKGPGNKGYNSKGLDKKGHDNTGPKSKGPDIVDNKGSDNVNFTGSDNKGAGNKKNTASKVFETMCLALSFVALSAYAEIYGPTLIDLKIKLDTGYEEVAVAVSGRSVGAFPGSIMAGFLVDRLSGHCHLIIAVCLDIAAIATAAIPWSPNPACLWGFCFVGGIVEAFINIVSTRILFNIWQRKSTPFLMLVHLGYGIGSFCVPIFSRPFLAATQSLTANETLNENTTVGNNTKSLEDKMPDKTNLQDGLRTDSKVEYAYGISACFAVIISIAFYIFQLRESNCKSNRTADAESTNTEYSTELKNKGNRSFKQIFNPAICANGRICYGSTLVFLVVIYLGNNSGADKMIGNFIRSFTIDKYGLDANSASALNTAYWITFSLGRFVFIFLARCMSVRVLIIFLTLGLAVSAGLLFIFAQNCSLLFWIIIQFFSFFGAAVLPTGIAWTEYHIELTGLVMMMQIFGMSVGGICHMSLIGYMYDFLGPKSFLIQILGYALLQFVLAVGLDSVGAIHGKRLVSSNKVTTEIKTRKKTKTHRELK